jgi:heat shock protein HtpX
MLQPPEFHVEGVAGTPALLVYDRIDANRRKTRLLLALFALVLLPVFTGIAAFFIVPSLVMNYGPAHPAEIASMQDQMRALRPSPDGTYHLRDLPPAFLWLYARVNLVATAAVTMAFLAVSFLFYVYGSRVVLRLARARAVEFGHEPDLVQVVENLCIAAGLPIPRLYVIESAAPNAFATGRTPTDASLVVTRGLLDLLDRRELESVIAHELSHIGNHDVGLTTTLAALVGTVSLPLTVLSAPFRFAFRISVRHGIALVAGFVFLFGANLLWLPVGIIISLIYLREYVATAPYVWWWSVYVTIAPFYAVWVAPVIALLIRQAVSRQREFLADADAALLTRNPEGLALALVKISAVRGERLRVGEGAVHLYFVDPRAQGSWLHVVFPSHPPVEKRIELLARMANGITPSAIQAARDAGARFQQTKSVANEARAASPDAADDQPAAAEQTDEPARPSKDGFTRLDDRVDGASGVMALPPTKAAGQVLTPLYELPDGWSRVIARLPENAIIIPIAAEGHFIRITTAEHQAGYVSRSAPLAALKNFHT